MRNNEIIFQRLRKLAENNGIIVRDVFETETELICIDIDNSSIPYKFLLELDNYLDQWNMIVISVDINLLSDYRYTKDLTVWIG